MEQDENQPGNTANSGGAEERIAQLTGEISQLRALLDQRNQLESQERERREQEQQQQQQQMGYDPNSDDVKQWGPWMEPKIKPFLAPRDQIMMKMADKIDELETRLSYPEYNGEEFQARVTKFIRDTHRNRGVILSRIEAITQLKGDDLLKGRLKPEEIESFTRREAGEGQQQQMQQTTPVTARRVSSPVETRGGIGGSRAATPTQTQNPEDLSWEDMEKQYRDMRV